MGAVFASFAGFYYWIGKITGLQYPETLGQIHFRITFFGVNPTPFPMHFPGQYQAHFRSQIWSETSLYAGNSSEPLVLTSSSNHLRDWTISRKPKSNLDADE